MYLALQSGPRGLVWNPGLIKAVVHPVCDCVAVVLERELRILLSIESRIYEGVEKGAIGSTFLPSRFDEMSDKSRVVETDQIGNAIAMPMGAVEMEIEMLQPV